MSNPYEGPCGTAADVSAELTSWSRATGFALTGYVVPFIILYLVECSKDHIWWPISIIVASLITWHWPSNIGWVQLVPNIACLLLFGWAGYTKCKLIPDRPLLLGIATLFGYFAMLIIPNIHFYFRSAWARTGFVLLFPVLLWIVFRLFDSSVRPHMPNTDA